MASIVIIAQGTMGSGVGRRLTESGHKVSTVLEGRSEASATRAKSAGMAAIPMRDAANCDLFLSILPPSEAEALARRMAPLIAAESKKPLYADMNAISPATMASVASIVAPSGASVVDGGIIGGPPKPGYSPSVYLAGAEAASVKALLGDGLDLRVMDGPVGAASSLKMCYAGLSKGFQALGTAMLSAAVRSGCGAALLGQLAESQPDFLAYFRQQVPAMFPKAYRFVGEMEEISAFLAAGWDPGASTIYAGMAELYEQVAADVDGARTTVDALRKLLAT